MATEQLPGQTGFAIDFLAGGGELGALMRAADWGSTALGPPEHWPPSLKTCVRIILTSRQAMFVWWGDRLINLYNDAYRAILGAKHPAALGQPAEIVWQEIWDQVGPRAESAMRRNEGTYDEKLLLIMERNGYPEETYYTFSYSPVPGEGGATGGIICANSDDTGEVISERQLTLLREQASATVDARNIAQACDAATRSLESNPCDLPFALIYLADEDRKSASLSGRVGINAGHSAAPETIVLSGGPCPWLVDDVIRLQSARHLSALADVGLPTGAWDRAPHQAAVLPITPSGQGGRTGVIVVGLNPYRLYDDGYQGFLTLVAAQLSSSIANARAYEEERSRAEALAEIDRAKTAFFSNVSHEFRTPLTLMLGPLEEAMSRLDGQVRDTEFGLIETAHRNGLRLLRLVNTLLAFSRIEAGRAQAVFAPVDLASITADLASTFRSACERAGLALLIDCPPMPEPVQVDQDMWEKIVLNLLSNAFKFTFEGSISVILRATDAGAELKVRDTGTGIPSSELPRLFERFHRVEGTRGRSFEGSGIGLALVQELVRLHGGAIRVASEPGEGSVFTVSVPFGTAHLPPDRVRDSASPAAGGTGAEAYVEEALRWLPDTPREQGPGRGAEDLTGLLATGPAGGRILLVDDNADMRDYVRRLLESSGYAVETAVDGVAALEAARRTPPDLVLSDVMMPRLDGFGLIRALRADPAFTDRPIILLSARAGEEARVEGLDAGADDYLTKPFSTRELLARVGTNLGAARARRENAAALQALNETLEVRVRERTGELAAANRQLLKQIEEREQVESTLRQMQRLDAIGQLTSGVAHDFNNLLTVILGNADSLARAPAIAADERLARRLANMRQAADRGAALTGQLLAFSRRQRLEPRPMDLNETVEAMSDLLRSSLGGSIELATGAAA